jgi:hypothetical protein
MVVDTMIEVGIGVERAEVEGTTVAAEEAVAVGVRMNVAVEVVAGQAAGVAKPCLNSAR